MKKNCLCCAIINTNTSYVLGEEPYTRLVAFWGKTLDCDKEGFKIIAEGEDDVIYFPKFCPECGKKVGD